MSRRRLDPWPRQLPPEEVQRVPCPACNAQPGEPCRSKQRVRKSHHRERLQLCIKRLQIDVRAELNARAEKKRYP
jgi:hypothetical protein